MDKLKQMQEAGYEDTRTVFKISEPARRSLKRKVDEEIALAVVADFEHKTIELQLEGEEIVMTLECAEIVAKTMLEQIDEIKRDG